MIKKIATISIFVVLAAVLLTGCGRDQNSEHFAKESAQGGMVEVQMGRLAAERGSNPAVKQFGQQMVDDHSKANNEMTQLAARKNIQLPQEMTAEQKSTMDKLSKLSGAEFDREYVDAMVKDHEHDVEDFQIQADKGNDADVKAFAAKTLPVLQKHLQMIRDIKSKM
jgi:putative membrane protein